MKLKYTFLNLIMACTAGLLFSSCQKDISTENGILPGTGTTPPHNITADSNYLSKIYELYNNTSGGLDTLEELVFYYDGQKRVTSVVDSIRDYPNMPYELSERMQFFYSGTDTVCNRYLDVFLESPDIDSTTMYFSYDNNLRKTKDSSYLTIYNATTLFSSSRIGYNYTYAPGQRFTQIAGTGNNALGGGSDISTGNDTASIDGAGNLAAIRRHLLMITNPGGTPNTYENLENYSFDSHPNPFTKLSIYTALHNADLNGTMFFQTTVTPNNVLVDAQQSYSPYTLTFTYQYNNAGYPVRAVCTGVDANEFAYVYKTL